MATREKTSVRTLCAALTGVCQASASLHTRILSQHACHTQLLEAPEATYGQVVQRRERSAFWLTMDITPRRTRRRHPR